MKAYKPQAPTPVEPTPSAPAPAAGGDDEAARELRRAKSPSQETAKATGHHYGKYGRMPKP